jgi:hypothetical protein
MRYFSAEFGRGSFVALAFPCVRVGMLALPLCGAAPTFFAAAKKVGKESRSHRQCDAVHHSPILVVVPERLSPRTIHVSDKALIPPATRYARHGRVCMGNHTLRKDTLDCIPLVLAMPFGARSAAGRMSALSLRLTASDDRRSGATTGGGARRIVAGAGGVSGFLCLLSLPRAPEEVPLGEQRK